MGLFKLSHREILKYEIIIISFWRIEFHISNKGSKNWYPKCSFTPICHILVKQSTRLFEKIHFSAYKATKYGQFMPRRVKKSANGDCWVFLIKNSLLNERLTMGSLGSIAYKKVFVLSARFVEESFSAVLPLPKAQA